MTAFHRLVGGVAMLAVTACAHNNKVATYSGPPRWTGRFSQSSGGSSIAVLDRTVATGHPSAYGDITITPVDSAPPRSRIDLSITAQAVDGGTQLAWAVFTGGCGSPTPPVTGIDEFPPIEISSGSARISTTINVFMTPHQDYHANVYWGSHASDASNIMLCANLTRGR